jgi:hypothetical protein
MIAGSVPGNDNYFTGIDVGVFCQTFYPKTTTKKP